MFSILRKAIINSLGLGCWLFLTGCSQNGAPLPDRVDCGFLLSRTADLTAFASAPLGESFLFSSHDKTGGNQDWFVYSKADANGRIKIFEAEGPGYISRFWIASFAAERWLFFFDGEREPRIDLAKDDLFGEAFPFVEPLAGMSGGGRYCMLPIPFSKSIRIEMVPQENFNANNRNYIQINYTKLAMKPESVESFPREMSGTLSNQIVRVNETLSDNTDALKAAAEQCLAGTAPRTIEAGGSQAFWTDDAAGLLKSFAVQIADPSAAEAMGAELLRKLRLQMFWDGMDEPSVDVPLGDFFCNPFYFRSFSSWPMGYVDGRYICRFPMPYKKGARCIITNTSARPVSLTVGAVGNRDASEGLSRRFHAVWRASNTTGRPLPIMEAEGSGHYVGCFMTAIGQDGSWNILEGDEFVRPDYGTQPPQLGTGLEDYFSGAYYYTSLFDLPFHGLIEKGAMRTDQYRFHMLETVPFEKTFDMGIEFGHGNRSQGYMSSVAYWYMDKPQAVPLSSAYTHLLARPADRYELPGLMAQLFLLERDGLWADAADRVGFFAGRYRTLEWVDLLKVRQLGYREKVEGFDAVRAGYQALRTSPYPPAAQAVEDVFWFQENETHALLGIHALGHYELKLDGKVIARGEGKNNLAVLRLPVSPGEHVWEADLKPTRQGSFFNFCLRTHHGDYTPVGDWERLEVEPLQGRTPPPHMRGKEVLPNMTIWAFNPTAYVGMQSPGTGIRLWSFYDSKPLFKRVVGRKASTIGESQMDVPAEEQEAERSEDELKAHAVN